MAWARASCPPSISWQTSILQEIHNRETNHALGGDLLLTSLCYIRVSWSVFFNSMSAKLETRHGQLETIKVGQERCLKLFCVGLKIDCLCQNSLSVEGCLDCLLSLTSKVSWLFCLHTNDSHPNINQSHGDVSPTMEWYDDQSSNGVKVWWCCWVISGCSTRHDISLSLVSWKVSSSLHTSTWWSWSLDQTSHCPWCHGKYRPVCTPHSSLLASN